MRSDIATGCRVSRLTMRLRIIALGSVWGMLPLAAFSQTLQIQPPSITAPSAEFMAEARIILQNPGAEALRNVSLGQFSNDGITAKLGKPNAAVAAPKSQIVWPVKIAVPSGAHLPGTVIFEASYRTGTVVNHLYASLTLQSDSAQKLVDATLDGTPDPVSQQRPSAVYLLVTNNMDVPVDVTVPPPSLSTSLETPPIPPFQVPPRSIAARRVDLLARSKVTPGVQPVAIDVDVNWTRDGQKDERHFALTKPVTVGVFFESELLKALGIPSFLVLPGCLVIFTMQLMLSLGIMGLKNQSNLPDLSVTSPGFWILSISLSFLFVPVYYWITGVNCLLSYGADDMRNIWVAGIVLGVLFYLGIARYTLNWRKEHVPSSSDTPKQLLEKLAKNGLGLLLPRVKFKLGNLELTGFVIEKIKEDQAVAWVAPHIAVGWKDSHEAPALKKKFEEIVNGNRDPAALAAVLSDAGGLVTLNFETKDVVPNPYHLKLDTITGYSPSDLIVG